ncbi:MAG: MoxR family ATPase [Gammaproteobacteria bacterium]|nr:MAG: MoxR family ATPase [Gammaproteobacteria bacterium]
MTIQARFKALADHLNQTIIGQSELTRRLIITLLADGHILLEGPPGLAKTRAAQALARAIDGQFKRIQFTPDLLPADITGSEIFRAETGTFEFVEGPVFHNLILADEINRAPAKVQSALLEAMAERQVTAYGRELKLSDLFMVMATQNPIEQEGTYPLPEAQLDRFLMHHVVDYPSPADELSILRLTRQEARHESSQPFEPLTREHVQEARKAVLSLYMSEPVERYIVELVTATRPGYGPAELTDQLAYGASPRATLALDRCARAHAWLQGKDHVSPSDIQAVLADVLRHRLILHYAAEARGLTADSLIQQLLEHVPAP